MSFVLLRLHLTVDLQLHLVAKHHNSRNTGKREKRTGHNLCVLLKKILLPLNLKKHQ